MTTATLPTRAAAQQPEPSEEARRRSTARRRDLTELLARRPDLVGVHPPADTVAATVTWSV
jgi:hypothetical protein